MAKYLDKEWIFTLTLKYIGIPYILRWENVWADTLSWLATLAENSLGQTYIEYLEVPNINEAEKFNKSSHEPS